MNPRTFESFAAAAVSWNETGVRLLAEHNGRFFYEVLEHNHEEVSSMPKHRRYGIACYSEDDNGWVAWACTDVIFGGEGPTYRQFPADTRDLFRGLYELLP